MQCVVMRGLCGGVIRSFGGVLEHPVGHLSFYAHDERVQFRPSNCQEFIDRAAASAFAMRCELR